MNTNPPESNKKEIPLLVRSAQWTIAERTENQVSAVCLNNKQDDMIVQLNQKIVQQSQMNNQMNQRIDQQSQMIDKLNQKIDSQNKLIEQQNKKIDDLNDLFRLQKDINAELQNRMEIQEKVTQNRDTEITVIRQPVPNDSVKSPSSGSRTNILMADSKEDPDATVFGSKIERSEISAIYTKDTLKYIPSSAWDVSDSRDGSVIAWTGMASDGKSHILFLAANGNIYANPNSSDLFANYTNLISADFTYLKMDLVTNTSGMFKNCNILKQLDVSQWDVSNVADMGLMFFQCKQLQTLDVSHWDVSNVTTMESMFYSCEQLQTLDVSHWDVSNVTDMWDMFSRCTQLQTLDVSHWDVSNVTNMMYMFGNSPYIDQLEKGALSSWKLNPDVYMEKIFVGTKFQDNPMDLFHETQEKIEQNKNTERTFYRQPMPNDAVESTPSRSRTAILMANSNSDPNASVFGGKIKCSEISAIYTKNTLENIPSSAWDVSAAKDGSVMAWTNIASGEKTLILYLAADGDFYANPDSRYLFANYTNLTTADFSHLKTNLVTNMHGMFSVCNNLKQLNVSHWDVSNVTDMGMMFFSCLQLQTLNVSHWDVSSVTNMDCMFFLCNQIQVLDVSQWDVSSTTRMGSMFALCKQLQTLDVSQWDVSSTTRMGSMFGNCKQLQTLDVSQWNVSNVTDMNRMFENCNQLQTLDVS